MTAPELLPCPFCGGAFPHMSNVGGNDERTGYRSSVIIHCTNCTAKVGAHDVIDKNGWSIAKGDETKERAITAWNTRAPTPGWRDIASAPKDGTEILVWDGERTIAQWIEGEWMPCLPDQQPTLWQPLPAAPGEPQ